jgi:hypothetical protein
MEQGNIRRILMYREKINEFIKHISDSRDSECLELIEDLISSAAEYVKRVSILELGIMVGKHNKDGEEYREYIQNLDKQRSNAHNALINNLKIINRLYRNNNMLPIYKGNEDNRVEIANFAQEIIDELFSTRRL